MARTTRNWMACLLMAAAVVPAVAACGSGGGQQPASGEQRLSDAARASAQVKQRSLRMYMARTRSALKAYRSATALRSQAQGLTGGRTLYHPPSLRAAQLFELAASRFFKAASLQRSAKPPVAVQVVNKQFAANMTAMGSHASRMGGASRSLAGAQGNMQVWTSSVARYNDEFASDPWELGVRARWRIEVASYGRSIGVALPPWARIVGTRR
jgi:hypothetical protein